MKKILAAAVAVLAIVSTANADTRCNIASIGGVAGGAAAATANNTAAPTAMPVRSFLMVYDGANFDMALGNSTNGLQVYSGTGALDLGKAEDGAHTTGDVGVMVFGLRAAAATDRSSGGTDGDYEPIGLDALGRVWTSGAVFEDAGHTSGDQGVAMLGVQQTVLTGLGSTTLDYVPMQFNAQGSLYVNETGHAAAVSGVITVATAGTSVQGASNVVKECWFSGPATNTGQCFLSHSTGDHRVNSLPILETASIGPVHIQNTNLVWADCITSGDIVAFFCTN